MKGIKKGLAILLVLCTLLSLVFVAGAAPMPQSADADQVQTTAANDGTNKFLRIFSLDCGRIYFSVEHIEEIIDTLAANDYTHLQLAFGNGGLRFLLNDMSVGEYGSEAVKTAIRKGNTDYAANDGHDTSTAANTCLTQDDMNAILKHASDKGIQIIPLLNSPGHFNAVVYAMGQLGITNAGYPVNGVNSRSTVNIQDESAKAFATALIEKYVNYFKDHGCTYFHMGADEFANDPTDTNKLGFTNDIKSGFVGYVNSVANMISTAGMTPVMFNDGYAWTNAGFNRDIVVSYWTSGAVSSEQIAKEEHQIINTNQKWYYVLGSPFGTAQDKWCSYASATNGVTNTKVTSLADSGNVGDKLIGAAMCFWCDFTNKIYTADEQTNVKTLISTLATNNPTYFTLQSKEPDATVEKIVVQVGGTDVRTINGINYAGAGDYTTDDTSIAIVEVTGKNAGDVTTTYTQASVTCNTLISKDSPSWSAAAGYYYTPDGTNYYPVYAKRSTSVWFGSTKNYTWGYSETDSASNVTKIGDTQNTNSTSTAPSIPVWTKTDKLADEDFTTITFTGVAPGTTYVTVGNTRYIIHVKEDLSGALNQNIYLRITTFKVWEEGDSSEADKLTLTAEQAYSENGVELSSLVPKQANWAYEGDGCQTVFWKGTVLPDGKHQSKDEQNDRSGEGTDFTRIRYWNKAWQYFSGDSWKTIAASDEVVAYYLQSTEVTDEVTTMVKDWGFKPEDAHKDDAQAAKRQVALSFAVVYSNGQLIPSEADIMNQSTIIYHLHNAGEARDIGLAYIENTDGYEVTKITWTAGRRDRNQTSVWTANDTVSWNKTTTDGVTWYDETTIWTSEDGTDPVIRGTEIGYQWKQPGDACLILIYVKARADLTVRYWDDSANTEIYNYGIAVDSNIDFNNGLTPGLTNGDLADNAYIVNYKNQHETFEKNLTQIPALHGKYASGLYSYVRADISEDGKTLTLHYNLDSSRLNQNYVVDFGLPVEIPISDFVANADTISSVQIANNMATYDGTKQVIRYEPARVFTGTVTLSVTVTFEGNTTQTFTVGLTPATTVYYEEGFATYSGDVIGGTNKGTVTQTASVAGSKAHYGYDAAYLNNTQDSNGTVATLNAGGEGRFTFTGTGVDVYACTMENSGKVMIYVYSGSGDSMTLKRLITVDTRQLGPQSAGGTAYNVPIVSLSGLERGEYTLVMKEVQTKLDNNNKPSYPVYIDGFRVHGTLDMNSEVYLQDNEANPTFVELRNAVLAGLDVDTSKGEYAQQIAQNAMSQVYASSETTNGAVVLDAKNTTISVNDLLDKGPKNELYLRNGQAVVFKIADGYDNVQVGLKVLNGSVNYTMNGTNNSAFATSTDMFYKVTPDNDGVVAITNNGGGILSITEVKAIPSANSASEASVFAALSANDLMPALLSMGFESEPVAATATLYITVQCGDKAVPVTLTADGMSGDTHTFTAAEIKAAVEKALPEGYNVDDVTFTDVTVVCGESADVSYTATQPQTPDTPTSTIEKIIAVAKRVINRIIGWFR